MSDAFDHILRVHLLVWVVLCVLAFAYHYWFAKFRCNPCFHGQLHCLSGIILCNRPLFGTLMCGFGGALFMVAANRVLQADSEAALVLTILMFASLITLVNYDVMDHKPVHFVSLGVLLVSGTAFLILVWLEPLGMLLFYLGCTCLFVLILAVNVTCTRWVWPCMTIQALLEILWVVAFAASVIVYAFCNDGVHAVK